MTALPVKAFIAVEVDPETWNIPDAYNEALGPHLSSIPTTFFLPWPPELLPGVGEEITFSGLPMTNDTLKVNHYDHYYSSSQGYRAYGVVKGLWTDDGKFNLQCLLCFSEEGFLVETAQYTIKEVLFMAGLPSTEDEYKAVHNT